MKNSKFGLRAFGLALMAALSLMAFTAVAAQAVNLEDGGKPAKFLVELNAALSVGTTFEANQVGAGTLLVPGRVDILCQKGKVTGTINSETDASAVAEFTECLTWQPVTELGASHTTHIECIVKEPVIAEALVLPKLHESGFFLLFESINLSGKPFAVVTLEGAACPLTKINEVKGSVVAEIDNNDSVEPLILFSHTIQKLFQTSATAGDHLKYGAFEAYVDADAKAKITSPPHIGKKLGIC